MRVHLFALMTLALAAGLVLVPVVAAAQENQPPQATPDSAEAKPGETIIINVLANDIDPEGDPLHIVDFDGFPNLLGHVEIVGDTFKYTAPPYPFAEDRFAYHVSDDYGSAFIESQVTITMPPPSGPSWRGCKATQDGGSIYQECKVEKGNFTYHYRLYRWDTGLNDWKSLNQTNSGHPKPDDAQPANGIPDQVDAIAAALEMHSLRFKPLGLITPPPGAVFIHPADNAYNRCFFSPLNPFEKNDGRSGIHLRAYDGEATAGHELFHRVGCEYTNWEPQALLPEGMALHEATADWFSGRNRKAEFLDSSDEGILAYRDSGNPLPNTSRVEKRHYGAHILFDFAPAGTVAAVYRSWGAFGPNNGYGVLRAALPADTTAFFARFWTWVHDNHAWPAQAAPALGTATQSFTTTLGNGGGEKYEFTTSGIGKIHVDRDLFPLDTNLRVISERADGVDCEQADVVDSESIVVKNAACTRATVIVSSGLDAASSTVDWSIRFQPAPPAPVVNAGPDQHIVVSSTQISASVTYAGSLDWEQWTKVSGPGTAQFFASAFNRNATLTIFNPGTHVLTFEVTDEYGRTASDALAIAFDKAPAVFAGPDLVTTTGSKWINATVIDDGGSPITYAWSNYGSVPVKFSNTYGIDTTATFTKGGTYALRLTARDGRSTRWDVVNVTYDPPPVVEAGPNRVTTTSTTWPFASVTNEVGTLSVTWSKVSGPGTVTWGGCGARCVNTRPSFSRSGVYTLRLTASDGRSTRSDTMRVTVNKPPTPNAGPNRTVYTRYTPVSLWIYGSTSDDWVSTVTRTWSRVYGPGTVRFYPTVSTSSTRTKARFYAFGTYKLRLKVSDGVSTRYDYVYVYVRKSYSGGGVRPI